MRSAAPVWTISLLVSCLSGIALLCLARSPQPGLPRPLPAHLAADRSRSPSDVALAEARSIWVRASLRASRSLEQLEDWDSAVVTGSLESQRWRELIAQAPEAPRALQSARRAAALARTPGDAYRAARLLALINCTLGRDREALEQARRLVALAPHDEVALQWLKRAARCNQRKALERRANAALAALKQCGPAPAGQCPPSGVRGEPQP